MRHHYLFNIVTEKENVGSAVLIRAIEPVFGVGEMLKNRKKFEVNFDIKNLTNGPGKLCQAFKITKNFDGQKIFQKKSEIFVIDKIFGIGNSERKILCSERVGISKSKEVLLRFYFLC